MVQIINYKSPDFKVQMKHMLKNRQHSYHYVDDEVRDIIDSVKNHGDQAVIKYCHKFDQHQVDNVANLRMTIACRDEKAKQCEQHVVAALEFAADRIRKHHSKMIREDFSYTDEIGAQLGWRFRAIESVALYVPGGITPYPSSVLMNAIPAIVASVKRVVLVTPAKNGKIHPAICAAAKIMQIDEIWKIGGAHAIAAMAYGTETIQKVDKIVGPGNAYVSSAKKQVFGQCGIDMIAGPTEVLIVADKHAYPDEIAADLLAQAEHDEKAQPMLIVDDEDFARKVTHKIEFFLEKLPNANIAKNSWQNNGVIIILPKIDENCVQIINEIAPEHLELQNLHPEKISQHVTNAAAIFIGRYTPEVFGDYTAGTNHVLPTAGTAKFQSGLSVDDFIKKITVLKLSPKAAQKLQKNTAILAQCENFAAHKLSVDIRDFNHRDENSAKTRKLPE